MAYARVVRSHRNVTFISLADGSLPGNETLQGVYRSSSSSSTLPDHQQLAPGVGLELTGRLKPSRGRGQAYEFDIEHLKVTAPVDAATYPIPLTSSSTPASNDLLRKYAHLRPREARHAAVLRARSAFEKAISDWFWGAGFSRVAAPILTSSDCEGGGEVFRVEQEQSEGAGPMTTPFFSPATPAFLTVSSQLHLEALAMGLGRVWTCGPSFRAEGSATNRHLCEFWMVEAEQLTSSSGPAALHEVMQTTQGVVQAAMHFALHHEQTRKDLEMLWQGHEATLQELESVASLSSGPWPTMTYTDAVSLLESKKQQLDEPPPTWGQSLSSSHERWLAQHVANGPLFITDYPSALKPFYMRANEDQGPEKRSTVACFDLVVPRLGELVGGSLREERLDRLEAQPAALDWYARDLRRYGCIPHGGFGLGLERLVGWLTNTDNLRDVASFPRTKGPLRY